MSDSIRFDLIVLSLSMVGDDSLRLASRLRAEKATHEIPLLLVAEPAQRERLLRGFDMGANDWLLRPVDENELRLRARNQIRRKFYQDRLRTDLGHALELALTDPMTGLYKPALPDAASRQPGDRRAAVRHRGADDRYRPFQVR
ncbi:MAG: hypothetical protein WDN49_09130 [Acetobacteraceae bacterium]